MVLLILDGWGLAPPERSSGDAIRAARTPNFDRIFHGCPSTTLTTHGRAVGLIEGQMGNSEVGHLNLGAGRVVKQDILRISEMIERGDFFTHPALLELCQKVRASGATLHLIGLVSDGGVHSHLSHLMALLELCRRQGMERVAVHALLDGRDTPPRSAAGYLSQVEEALGEADGWCIATIGGRYFGMDRDRRWDRLERAWRAIVLADGPRAASWQEALEAAYARGESDEFVNPTLIVPPGGEPVPVVDGDGVIFFNFRADRARQLTHALLDEEFPHFDRVRRPRVHFLSFKRYEDDLDTPVLLEEEELRGTLTEHLSSLGLRVFKTAETEKYAHVTYFFNGGREEPFPGEERVLIDSPKVATYDLVPEMSLYPVTETLTAAISRGEFALLVANFANPDMVGHTGVFEAAVRACEHVDICLGRVLAAARSFGYAVVVTADHGNADEMLFPDGTVSTQHSKNPTPLIVVAESARGHTLRGEGMRSLCHVAPTVLDLMGIEPPPEMEAESLILKLG